MAVTGEVLIKNEELSELRLLYHSLTSEGIGVLSSSLGSKQSKLRQLHISGAPIKGSGTMALLGAVQNNPSWIEVIDLPRRTHRRSEIQHFADLNKAGWSRIFRRSEKKYSTEMVKLWPYIFERANSLHYCKTPKEENQARRANAIFHLLRGSTA